jgi:hypothetical protein
MLTKRVSSNKHWLVSDPRQDLENYKLPNFGNTIKYYVLYIVALSDRCWVKTLAACVPYPCLESIP